MKMKYCRQQAASNRNRRPDLKRWARDLPRNAIKSIASTINTVTARAASGAANGALRGSS